MNQIKINNSDRVAFVGASGMGKTELAKFFLSKLNRVVVIDPKHTFKLDGFKVIKKDWRLPYLKNNFKIIVRPKINDDEDLFEFLYKLQKVGNIHIYIDEMAVLTSRFPQSVSLAEDIAVTGRERRVALWSATQRPRGTPRVFFTETENLFLFKLRAKEDREYMSGFIGDEGKEVLSKYHFWYIRIDDESPVLLTLDPEKKIIKKIKKGVENVN